MAADKYFFQPPAIAHAVHWANNAKRGDYILYAGPTGCGKSFVELGVQEFLGAGWWIITPRLSIARGFIKKRGLPCGSMSELIAACWALRICTPIRFRNALFKGDIPHVAGIIFDEAHHASADSWREDWLASGMPPVILYTATPYRGTPRSTAKFREMWGEPTWIITLSEAARTGVISIPTIEVLPLVDDDQITLNSVGEFEVTALESATNDRLEDLAAAIVGRFWDRDERIWDRPSVICLPSTATAHRMQKIIASLGAVASVVTAKTKEQDRPVIFQSLIERSTILCQVSVLGEGVDLPIRRLIDAAPVISPSKWMQQFGRATRPVGFGEPLPEYICTNRNLTRHAYLLDGLIPSSVVAAATAAFGAPSQRIGSRVVGLENLGKFKATHITLTDGNIAQLYLLVDVANGRMTEYACICHPALEQVVWATRTHQPGPNGEKRYAHWRTCEAPAELFGFATMLARKPSEAMQNWWDKSAEWHGLRKEVTLNARNFAVLPICKDLGLRLVRKVAIYE